MHDDTPQIGRREFLKRTAALTAVGASCLGPGLREALAQAKKAGKPLLSEKALNAFIKQGSDAAFAKQVKAANSDLVKFLSSHFHLTETQIQELGTLSAKDKRELAKGLEQAVKHKVRPTVKISHISPKPGNKSPAASILGLTITVSILHDMMGNFSGVSVSVGKAS